MWEMVSYFAGLSFKIIAATLIPAFRYFQVFDEAGDFGFWTRLPKVQRWRRAVVVRPSVAQAMAQNDAAVAAPVLAGPPFGDVAAHGANGVRAPSDRRMWVRPLATTVA
jgi:hypothetical protein